MSFYESNGILAKIPGALISKGSDALPPPSDGQPAEMSAMVDTPELGRVRITYKLSSSRHHKSRNWFWTAKFAEAAQ